MKKIIVAALTATAIAAVGGGAVATINLTQVGAPMSEEPQTIIPEPEPVVEETKETIVVEQKTEPVVETPKETPKEETKPQPKPEPEKDEFGNDIDLAYKALCDYVLATENPDQLEGLKIYKPDAYKWLAEAGYKSVMEYLKDPNYISKVHYPRSIYQTYFGLFTSCLNKK